MEKRSFTRVMFQTDAVVSYEGGTISGKVENLSMNGMFLRTPEKIPRDTLLAIRVSLSGATSELSIQLKGIVVRPGEDGAAIQFKEMDLDSFIHLKNVVAYNCGDEGEVMEEVYKHIEQKKHEEF